jgi:lysophospholipase L1-like esterase
MQLIEQLRRHGVVIDDPRIIAVTGWTTDELSAGMDRARLALSYDLVTLQIGVNNQYRGRSAGEYRGEFSALLRRAIRLAGNHPNRVVVVSIPDWGVTRFARENDRDPVQIAHELDVFNAIARDEVSRAGARFVDITGISRAHPQLVADDGLHPSAAQYTLWTNAIAPVVNLALRSPR